MTKELTLVYRHCKQEVSLNNLIVEGKKKGLVYIKVLISSKLCFFGCQKQSEQYILFIEQNRHHENMPILF